MRRSLFAFLFAGITAASLPAQETVWLEGESPTKATVKFETGGWGHAEYLSGGSWLHGNVEPKDMEAKIPAEGAVVSYDFEAKAAGDYEAWARVGYEFARSPFSWRLDDGAWKESKPDELTTDLMCLQDWNEVAWLKLGGVALQPGKHTFAIKFDRQYKVNKDKKEPDHLVFGLDAICLSRDAFRPNGPHKPGEKEDKPIDREAAAQVFEAKPEVGGERGVTPLDGAWQIARWDEQEIKDRTEPVKDLPADLDRFAWMGVKVPGSRDAERPDLLYCHRFLYRTKINVPASMKGRAFFLHFPSTSLIASAFVNGRYCGGSIAPYAAWDADATAAIKPGQVNDVVVAIKDYYYALNHDGDGRSIRRMFNIPAEWVYTSGGLNIARFADFPVVLHGRANGIVEPATFVTCGGPYADDVFAIPSVKKKELGLEITVKNPTDAPVTITIIDEIAPLGGGRAEKTFAGKELTVAAGKEEVVKLSEKWENPNLWWPDEPNQYVVTTTIQAGDRVLDVKRTKFGFREWGWSGQCFTLNGLPWHLRADTTDMAAPKDPEAVVKRWQRVGQNMFRYWGTDPWTGRSQEETLDFFDAHGVNVRRSGIFDGEAASYLLVGDGGKARQDLFDHWRTQLHAWVKAERNHPSIFIWSIENEITFINARNLGWLDAEEPEVRKGAEEVMAFDPTRPAMIDGGDATRNRGLPVYGNHYIESPIREYPDEAYTLARAFHGPTPQDPWPRGDDKPLFLGESFFASGSTPSAYAQLSGDSAFLGWPEARKGVGLMAKMLSEGYRWHGVAAFHFWLGDERADLHYQSWQPVCVLCREWDASFAPGTAVKRTLKVFNDTRFDDPVEMAWSLNVGDKTIAGDKQTFHLKPGTAEETSITFTTPAVAALTPAELVLTCSRGGKEVFREVKPYWMLTQETAAKPALAKEDLVILDPKGVVKERLAKRGVAFTEAESVEKLPARMKVLVVGPDALTPRQATDPMWQALAADGVRVLVLDQENPLHYQAVPADLEVTDRAGRIAFPENPTHPAFRGLPPASFLTWSKDHLVYRNAYKKASKGARSLLQCDEELSCTALCECPLRDGLLVLCQALAGSKFGSDPVAQRLFDNLLDYCADYKPLAKRTAVVFPADDLRGKLLDAIGMQQVKAADVLEAISDPKNEIVVADASPANLQTLAAHGDAVKQFTGRGGWLMLWGLTPAGLADFNKVVGRDHVIRPFRMERVTMPAVRDPILSGLTARDVVLESAKKIFPWSGDVFPADDAFTNVVDLDDEAPFCKASKDSYLWGQITNGLLSADAWVFIYEHNIKDDPHPKWSAELPREEEVIAFSIVPNAFDNRLTKLKLTFHGDAGDELETLDLKPENALQDFELKPHRCKSISLEPLEWQDAGKRPLIGIDNIWIRVKRPDEWKKNVTPLLNIGALVKYRMGEGGIILNDVKVQETESNPVNVQKKQNIVATLLRNLGAAFAGERVLVAGADLKYTPIPLGDRCNQFLTKEKGWYNDAADLSAFPVGENTLSGVRYQVRDFRTSPLPACVMLAGPGVKGRMADAVEGIPAGVKADALFFLHTFRQAKEWKPSKEAPEPPAVFEYVVHYADGKTAEAPVRYGRGVGDWLRASPQGLPEAAVAWAAPLTKDGRESAVVYQMQWTNPRPEAEIQSIDIRYDPKVGGQYGAPAVLGITAGATGK